MKTGTTTTRATRIARTGSAIDAAPVAAGLIAWSLARLGGVDLDPRTAEPATGFLLTLRSIKGAPTIVSLVGASLMAVDALVVARWVMATLDLPVR